MPLKFSEFTINPVSKPSPITTSSNRNFNLAPLLSFIRTSSPFYAHLPVHAPSLHDLPITDPDAYWARWRDVLTAPITADVVTRAGSLTDGGKKVFLSKEEVDIAASMSAEVLVEGGMGLRAGDRVADVMEPTDASPQSSFTILPISVIHLPFNTTSPHAPIEESVSFIEMYDATVLLATYSTLVRIMDSGAVLPKLRLVMYSGRCFSPPNPTSSSVSLPSLADATFPNAVIRPSEFSSLATGLLGIPTTFTHTQNNASSEQEVKVKAEVEEDERNIDADVDSNGNLFKVVAPLVVLEIVDTDGRVIVEEGVKGRVLATHLVRRLQPLVRFPTGAWAMWVDYGGEVFRVVER